MNELEQTLAELATLNYSGAIFLLAYGATWLVCALLWRITGPQKASLATLFQGMVALPIALGVSAALGMFNERPGGELITQLSILVAMSQLLALPLLIMLSAKRNQTAIPLIFSVAGAIHFLPYAWLYQTPAYIIMAVLLAVVLAVLYVTDKKALTGQLMSQRGAGLVCAATGVLLVTTGLFFVIL